MNYTRLTIALSESEMNALQAQAQDDLRNPREQALYLVRVGLGIKRGKEGKRTKNESGAVVVQTPAPAL